MQESGIQADAKLQALSAEFWDHLCKVEPAKALMAGRPSSEYQLWKFSPVDATHRLEASSRLMAQLVAIDERLLSAESRTTAGVLRHELTLVRIQHDAKCHLRPTLFPLGPDFLLNYVANMVGLDSDAKALAWVEHLRAVPAMLAGLQESLIAGRDEGFHYPRLVLERAVGNVRGLLDVEPQQSSLLAPFRKVQDPSSTIRSLEAAATEQLQLRTLPAIQGFARFLETELMPFGSDCVAASDALDGARHYAALIRQFVTVDVEPSDVHELGLSEVSRLTREIAKVADAAGFAGSVDRYRQSLADDPAQFLPSAKALRERIEVLSKRIDALIPQYFGRIPRTTYGVRLMPEAVAEKMPPAYAQFNPADGSAAGIHWLTSLPAKCPRHMHLPLALHEAWPGHLMHIAVTQELSDLPDFRRYGATGYSSWLEGWALYCEELGLEMGLYTETWEHYGRLEMELWRAVRLVVDTGLHARRWSRHQAIEYMTRYLALPPPTIEAEVDRYIGMPAQALSYQLGKLAIKRVLAQAQATLGERFRLKAFHDAFLALGPVTLPVMEACMRRWVEAQAVA